MTTLIRLQDGRETPAPGRWIIAPGQPVDTTTGILSGRRGTARTIAGSLLITEQGSMAFRLAIDATAAAGLPWRTLEYQSLTVGAGPGEGHWTVDGELLVTGRILPARSSLAYHGVFRSPLALRDRTGAIARLGWHLKFRCIPGGTAGSVLRCLLSADLTAHAPHQPDESRS